MSGRVLPPEDLFVAVTHELEEDDPLVRALDDSGVFTLTWSAVRTVAVGSASFETALSDLTSYTWLVVTSRRAVERVVKMGAELPTTLHVAVVGERTARAARKAGWAVSLEASGPGAEALGRELAPLLGPSDRVLFPASEQASDALEEALRSSGAAVERVTVYRTDPVDVDVESCRAALDSGIVAAITFLSPSAAGGLMSALDGAGLGDEVRELPAVSIGPESTRTLQEMGFRDVRESPSTTKRAVAETVLRSVGLEAPS